MRQLIATFLATIAASLSPALAISAVLLGYGGSDVFPTLPLVFLFATIVSFLHTLLFGLVTAGWLLRVGRFRLFPALVSGMIIGALPAAIWNLPQRLAGSGAKSWLDYLQFVGYASGLGAIGAVAFYLVYTGMSSNSSFKVTPDGAPQLNR
jgi:hypothetical protein